MRSKCFIGHFKDVALTLGVMGGVGGFRTLYYDPLYVLEESLWL